MSRDLPAAITQCPFQAKTVFNLTFHGLGEPGPGIVADEKRYWLAQDYFVGILKQATQWPDARMTFDDGNISDLAIAVPQLLRHRLRAGFFIVASRVGKQGYLGRSELRELLAAGMAVGSHGMRHQPWRRLRGDDLRQEIQDSKAMLEDLLGIPIIQAACPFGDYDRRVLSLLRAAGYSRVYTSDRGWAKWEAWLQARNTITATTSLGDLEKVRAWSCARQLVHQCKLALKRCR